MNKKNKTVIGIFVTILILGTVSTFAGALFTKPQLVPDNQSANLNQQVVSGIEVSTTPATVTTTPSLQGFQGLDQESKSLNLGK